MFKISVQTYKTVRSEVINQLSASVQVHSILYLLLHIKNVENPK